MEATQRARPGWHDESGVETTEWVGLMAAVAALLVAIVLAMGMRGGSLGDAVVDKMLLAINGSVGTAQTSSAQPGSAASSFATAALTGPAAGIPVALADPSDGAPAQGAAPAAENSGGMGWLDWVQVGLDGVGLIPAVGEIADGLNALISLGRGDYVGAGLSAAAMIPFIGWGSTGAKWARTGLEYSDEAAAALRGSDEAAAVLRQSDEADALLRRDPCLSWSPLPSGRARGLMAPAAAPPCSFPVGSAQHKQQRWQEYLERMRSEGKEPLSYDQWSNVYEANIQQARRSSQAVQAYRDQRIRNGEDWPDYEATVDVDGNGTQRRLDIANVQEKRAIEHKQYESGRVNNTEDISWEVERDAMLVDDGWQIEWVFEGTEPSRPLREALEQAGITITIID
jgi:hypothetical protein